MAIDYFFEFDGEEVGPISKRELRNKIVEGQLSGNTLVRPQGRQLWIKAKHIEGLQTVCKQKSSLWYYRCMGITVGPLSSLELGQKVRDGEIDHNTLVKRSSESEWVTADQISGLIDPPRRHSNPRVTLRVGRKTPDSPVPIHRDNEIEIQWDKVVLAGAVCLAILFSLLGSLFDTGENYNPYDYDDSSPYAPSSQTIREIDQMIGTKAEKDSLKRTVERFNRAAAERGERPTGL